MGLDTSVWTYIEQCGVMNTKYSIYTLNVVLFTSPR
jgi:hypothetical protein